MTHRRIEITAFRHRVTLVCGGSSGRAAERIDSEVRITNAGTYELIDAKSAEGRIILTEMIVVRRNLLDSLAKGSRQD